MKKIYYTVLFLTIDLVSKTLAEAIAPQNEIFHLVYNKNMAGGLDSLFGYDLNTTFVKFILPILALPLFIYPILKISKGKNIDLPFGMIIGGMIGNIIGRFSDDGVIDFLNFGFCIVNMADVFQWVGYLLIVWTVFVNEKIFSFSPKV